MSSVLSLFYNEIWIFVLTKRSFENQKWTNMQKICFFYNKFSCNFKYLNFQHTTYDVAKLKFQFFLIILLKKSMTSWKSNFLKFIRLLSVSHVNFSKIYFIVLKIYRFFVFLPYITMLNFTIFFCIFLA